MRSGRGRPGCAWQAWESPDKTISFQVGVEWKALPPRSSATVAAEYSAARPLGRDWGRWMVMEVSATLNTEAKRQPY